MSGIIWLASYPKSGNTWMRAFFANYLNNGPRPVDINNFFILNFGERRLWDEALGWETTELKEEVTSRARLAVQVALSKVDEVCFKTHDAFVDPASKEELFSREATRAAIYVVRNPLDVAPSYANHMNVPLDRAITQMNNPQVRLADNSKNTQLQMTQIMGDWSWHVTSWADAKGLKLHVVRYEDMLESPVQTFGKICSFLGFPSQPKRLGRAIAFSKFDALKAQEKAKGFKERPADCPKFFNEGRSGRWREILTPRHIEQIKSAHEATMKRFGYWDETPAGP